jgi:hypothetical protein
MNFCRTEGIRGKKGDEEKEEKEEKEGIKKEPI